MHITWLRLSVGLLLQAHHAHLVGAAATCKRIVFKGEWETVHRISPLLVGGKNSRQATELA